MPFKDILVHVAAGDVPHPAAEAAAIIARAHEARLTGLGVEPLLPSTFYGPGYVSATLAEKYLAEGRAAMAAAKLRFEATLALHELSERGEWRTADGEPATALAECGRCSDLIVVDQTIPGREPISFGVPAELALHGGRPVLAIPYIGTGPEIGRHIVIAWNGGREAARAVSDAMPFLTRAQTVEVLSVSPRSGGARPCRDIVRHLDAHGIAARVEQRQGAAEAGTEILNVASDHGADMIVMGCYGHLRMREAIFGGATRTVLSQMTVPVLLSH